MPLPPPPPAIVYVQDAAQLKEDANTKLINYGEHPEQFGQLFLPDADQETYPVLIVLHGGCWQSFVRSVTMESFSEAFRQEGIAVWNLEYRRLGNGGGYPATFQDVAKGTDYLREIAKTYPLDLTNVVIVGHSSGGHLALWSAARQKLAPQSPLYAQDPLELKAVVSLAGITDLRRATQERVCDRVAQGLIEGYSYPERYLETSPQAMMPLGVKQLLIQGKKDRIVPEEHMLTYIKAAQRAGDDLSYVLLEEADHFALSITSTASFQSVKQQILDLFED